MKITLVVVGKTKKPYFRESEGEYERRLKHYSKFEEVVIPELKNASKLSRAEIKEQEGTLILNKIKPGNHVILLDENGKMFTSTGFASIIDKLLLSGTKHIVFVVGGAYGFSSAVYNCANQKLSLSKMTFSHQMVRTVFKEQLYRAFTILKGEPYHHS